MTTNHLSKPDTPQTPDAPDTPESPQQGGPADAADPAATPAGQAQPQEKSELDEPAGKMAELAGMLNNHKGKLAVGAAAMLGVAIFYKWRESRLAKEDPEEYARLQRLKKAIGGDSAPADETTDTSKPE